QYLLGLKPKKTKAGISKTERVPNREEVKVLIQASDTRLRIPVKSATDSGNKLPPSAHPISSGH
ncbi:MAG: hypothetical protein MUQ30_00935, partial [Anaerolineae bacterium]|nr:hypothetical protein [Anaerolineae bacterium]